MVYLDLNRLKIMQALKSLHDAGIEHGDLQPWNVLDYDGSLRIVDLHLAMVHTCPARNQVMTEEFCFQEAIGELLCDELIAVGERMGFGSQDAILYMCVVCVRKHEGTHSQDLQIGLEMINGS